MNAPSALFNTPDATAQAAYAENVKNFLTAMGGMGLPTFDPSDLDPVIILYQVYKLLSNVIITCYELHYV